MYLQHGQPLVFGKERDKGIRLNGVVPEVVTLGNGVTEDDLLFHDEKMDDSSLAFLLSRMQVPAFPEPLGIFRRVHRPTYENLMKQQIEDARSKNGAADMAALLEGADSWDVT